MNMRLTAVKWTSAAVLGLMMATQSFAGTISFKDVEGVLAHDKIIALQEQGFVKGVAQGVFAPSRTITAAESVQMLVNAFGLNLDTVRFIKEPKATDYFKLANNDAWYADALITASVNSLELPADMDPSAGWTKEMFLYTLVRGMENHYGLPMINIKPSPFADEDKMNVSYSGAIHRAVTYGIVTPDANGNIQPTADLSRAEAAEMVYNALAYIKAHPAPVTTQSSDTK